MIQYVNVLASLALLLFTTNEAPAVIVPMYETPQLEQLVCCTNIFELAVTAVLLIVEVPPENVPESTDLFAPDTTVIFPIFDTPN